jgi:hypothetical protein
MNQQNYGGYPQNAQQQGYPQQGQQQMNYGGGQGGMSFEQEGDYSGLPGELIPDNTLAFATMTIKGLKGGQGGKSRYIEGEFTVQAGPFQKRKVWMNVMDPYDPNLSEVAKGIAYAHIRHILDVRGQGYNLTDYAQLDGCTVAIKIGVEKGEAKPDGSGMYPDKNTVKAFLSPTSKSTGKDFATLNTMHQQGYPQQQAAPGQQPQQGYAPQGQQGYATQGQGGYAPQGQPMQGQGYAPQGGQQQMPQNQGYPQGAPQGQPMGQQQMPPQGQPMQQGYPQQGQGYAPQGQPMTGQPMNQGQGQGQGGYPQQGQPMQGQGQQQPGGQPDWLNG